MLPCQAELELKTADNKQEGEKGFLKLPSQMRKFACDKQHPGIPE